MWKVASRSGKRYADCCTFLLIYLLTRSQPRASLESLEKGSNPQEKSKDDKKKKEKKGMLSGLFKRKDKKKTIDE